MKVKFSFLAIALFTLIALTVRAESPVHLTGAAATEHLDKLRARSRALDAAVERLRAKGFTTTETVEVFRAESTRKFRPVQDSFASSDGELVFWTWEAGST
jgi:hypothetical protein